MDSRINELVVAERDTISALGYLLFNTIVRLGRGEKRGGR